MRNEQHRFHTMREKDTVLEITVLSVTDQARERNGKDYSKLYHEFISIWFLCSVTGSTLNLNFSKSMLAICPYTHLLSTSYMQVSISLKTDVEKVQILLNLPYRCSSECLLPISFDKCCVLLVGGLQPQNVHHIERHLL